MSDIVKHYGTPRHSGRYPWGSGKNPQRHQNLISREKDLKNQGLSERERANALGYKSTTDLRAALRIAKNEINKQKYDAIQKLAAEGKGATQIARELGLKNESSVRSFLDKKFVVEGDLTTSTANVLKDAMTKNKYIDIGEGVENQLGITKDRLKTSVAMLKNEGYEVISVQVDQLGTQPGNKTTIKVLAPPGTTYSDVNQNTGDISSTWFRGTQTEDGGLTYRETEPPRSIDSKRIFIKYAEDGGVDKDGVIELRPGVEDLNLGAAKYAQVRIAVDDKYYLKGMAVYSNKVPEGYDVILNSNKPKGTPNEKVFKEMKFDENGNLDKNLPFGALTKDEEKLKLVQRHYIDKDGNEQLNCINVVNEQGDWLKWKTKISSQFLSKQLPDVAKKQLDLTYAQKNEEFEEIKSLTNPIVKKAMLQEFSDNADSSAVDLKATGFSRQQSKVILPVNSLKENEVYAPTFDDGEPIVLVRFPYAGRFESPLLKVNNKNKEGREVLGNAPDAIGINTKVAQQLSGADFDGDSVVCIPVKNVNIKTEKVIEELRKFEPKVAYAIPDNLKMTKEEQKIYEAGKNNKAKLFKEHPELKDKIERMTPKMKGRQMGEVSNLITDMTLKDAPQEDIVRAVKHSMVVIDAEKHYLNWKQSEKDNNIQELRDRYQAKPDKEKGGGASTLISKAKSDYRIDEVKEIKTLTPKNMKELTPQQIQDFHDGKKVYVKTGKIRYTPGEKDAEGNVLSWKGKVAQTKTTKMAWADDAMTLSSGTIMEEIYGRYANKLKSIANNARKIMRTIKPYRQDKEAAKKYAAERESLNKQLNEALKNKPLERAAQNYAGNTWKQIRERNKSMDYAEEKKEKGKLLEVARKKMGSGKTSIWITDKEWEAIQAKAVSSSVLESIIANADKDRLKELALPRASAAINSSKVATAKAKLNAGYTQAEVAEDLGISISTLNKALAES